MSKTTTGIVKAILHGVEKSTSSYGRWVVFCTVEFDYPNGKVCFNVPVFFWRKAEADALRVGDKITK